MGSSNKYMKCKNATPDCFANKENKCMILSNTTFETKDGKFRECPFYKNKLGLKNEN